MHSSHIRQLAQALPPLGLSWRPSERATGSLRGKCGKCGKWGGKCGECGEYRLSIKRELTYLYSGTAYCHLNTCSLPLCLRVLDIKIPLEKHHLLTLKLPLQRRAAEVLESARAHSLAFRKLFL